MNDPPPANTTPSPAPPGAYSQADHTDRIVWRRLLQRKLLIRVTIPTAIGLVQLTFAIIAIANGRAPIIILLWVLPAFLVGFWFGRRTKIAWDSDSAQVSVIQAQILLVVAYIIVRIATHFAIDRTLSNRAWVADVVLLVSFGLFFGRSVGLAIQIWHALTHRPEKEMTEIDSA